ncbi:MAG TPA: transglycosylase SLT domain-containing protein [Burkholderiales bacterium]|nr:transglycosylase SLT domain-containing protein [Burkholderiales bacterium]
MAGPAMAAPPVAPSADEDFLAARDAFRLGNAARLEKHAARLKGYPLEPYVTYYRLRLRLEDAEPAEVRRFLDRHPGSLIADNLRVEWLKLLGKREQWELFAAEYPKAIQGDGDLNCYALRARLRAGDAEALREARASWFTGRDLPESCAPLADALVVEGLVSADDVWARIRLALEAGNVSVARRAAQYLPPNQGLPEKPLAAANDNPQKFLERKPLELGTRAGREMVLFALVKLAKSSPGQAYFQYSRLRDDLSGGERAYALGQIAYQAARRQDPQALAWFKEAGNAHLDDVELAWRARATLRSQDWGELLTTIEAMSESAAGEPVWRYWKARALKSLGHAPEANALLALLSVEHNFYGQLALEEFGSVFTLPPAEYKAGAAEVREVEREPGIQRALAFYRLGLRTEGTREWSWEIRRYDDQRLLAAAEVARRNQLYDRAINTADRTVQVHDFDLRYLAPYREEMRVHTAPLNLDEAYVYGLIRQESRFISDARSSAGAQGLMQLMPATARWVARKAGMKDFHPSRVAQVDTNLALGTWYLRYVLDLFDGQPVMAAAAYNAGPGRARAWRDGRPLEGAIYAETIPFTETRDYVKKVMSNATYYSAAFGHPWRSLKQRLGMVAPPPGAEPLLEPEQ